MYIGHNHPRAIPFWCSLIFASFTLALMSACSDRSTKAAENAAFAQNALESNNLAAARSAIGMAIAERDDILEYHMLRGRIERASGSSSGAYDAYSNALALDPTNGQALLAVAELGLATGNLRESLEATERILTLAPNQLDALLIRGIHSLVRRDYSEAIDYAEKILELAPGDEGGTILKSRALFMSGEANKALAAVDQASGAAASSQAASLTRLEIYRALRRPSDMLVEFERLRALRPDDLALHTDEANLLYKLDYRRRAHELVETVLASPEASAEQAASALALWQEYGADDVPEEAVARIGAEGSVAARQALVRFLLRSQRPTDAAPLITDLPATGRAGLQARQMLVMGRSAEALRLAQAILRRDATDCDALIAASGAALQQGSSDDALRFGQIASSECPDLPGAWIASARAYQALGRESGVKRVFAEALDANKQSSALTEAYTSWLVAEGRSREAVAMARRLTRYAPALISGWQLYQGLCGRFDETCVAEAERGLANARTTLGVDLPPGTPPPNGLFGRLVER